MSGTLRTVGQIAISGIGAAISPLAFAGLNLAYGLLFPADRPKQSSLDNQIEINGSEQDVFISEFWGTVGHVGGNVINVAKNSDGEPAGVLVVTRTERQGGKGGGQKTEVQDHYLVAEYLIGTAGAGDSSRGPNGRGPLFVDELIVEDSDGERTLFNRNGDTTEERGLTLVPQYSAGGTLIAEYSDDGMVEFHLGTEEQSPSPAMLEFHGAGNVCPHRGSAKVVFNRLPITSQPNFKLTVRCAVTGRREIIRARLRACGLPSERVYLQFITGEVEAAAVTGRQPGRELCEKLALRAYAGFAFNNCRVEDFDKRNIRVWDVGDSDLAAREGASGEENELPDKAPVQMKGEEEFFSEVSVSFLDIDSNYEGNSVTATAPNARHSNPNTVDLPEASRIGDVLPFARALRDEDALADRTVNVSLLPAHCRIAVGNGLRVPHRRNDGSFETVTYLITEGDVSPLGLLTFRGVPHDADLVYSQAGFISETARPLPAVTPVGSLYYQLWDGPALADGHTGEPGFYAAATWPDDISSVSFAADRAGVITSRSGGDAAGNLTRRAVLGETEGVLADFAGGTPGVPSSGWDDSTLIIRVRPGGSLSDATDEEVLSGPVNALRVGDEIAQFVYATFLEEISDGAGGTWERWEVSRLRRGQLGTEWAMPSHATGNAVMLLDGALLRINVASWAIDRAEDFQFVWGRTGDVRSEDVLFTVQGRSLKPLSCVNATGYIDGSGDWQLSWYRRTRYQDYYLQDSGAPLMTAPPDTDNFEVDILDGPDGTVLRTIAGIGPAATYTVPQMVADFGSAQSTLHVRIYRLSQVATALSPGGRGYELEATITD